MHGFSVLQGYNVLHLSKVSSNHHHTLVKCETRPPNVLRDRPFRFQAAWLANNHFNQFVKEAWNQELTYNDAVNNFMLQSFDWNWNVFGKIVLRKKWMLARLGGILRALEEYYSQGLIDLEKQLEAELKEVLSHEEIIWLKKSHQE